MKPSPVQPQPELSDEPAAILRREGDRLVPSILAQGPWHPDHLHGGPICGVLARAIEACESPAPMRVARMTVEMTRAVPMEPLAVRAQVTRAGKRIQQVDAHIEAQGRTLARATALRMRVTEPDRDGALAPDEPVPERKPGPAGPVPRALPFLPGFIRSLEFLRPRAPEPGGLGVIWARMRVPLVEGEVPTPFVRLAAICDFASGAGNALDFTRFTSINPDLSLHVLREPRGEWIGITARSRIEPDGIGHSHATLFDDEGPVARALVSLLVERR
jgi:acyl-Coa thioesterase superfamily protein/acyl-CoA thioesterase superfamily protein